jgi:hypothetical protein
MGRDSRRNGQRTTQALEALQASIVLAGVVLKQADDCISLAEHLADVAEGRRPFDPATRQVIATFRSKIDHSRKRLAEEFSRK